jgi:hypothetical protein
VKISEKVHLVGFYTLVNKYRTMNGMYNIKIRKRFSLFHTAHARPHARPASPLIGTGSKAAGA